MKKTIARWAFSSLGIVLMVSALSVFTASTAQAQELMPKAHSDTMSLVQDALANQAAATEPTISFDLKFDLSAEATAEVEGVLKLTTDADGKIMLGPVSNPTNKGALHWRKKDGLKCPTVANQPRTIKALKKIPKTHFNKKGAALKRFKKAVPSAKVVKRHKHGRIELSVRCYLVAVGGTFTDTGEDPNGAQHGVANIVTGTPMLFDTLVMTVKDDGKTVTEEVSIRRGQVAPGSKVFGVGDCLNPKAKKAEFKPGQYVYVMQWNAFRWERKGLAKAQVGYSGSATISNGPNCNFTLSNISSSASGSAAFTDIVTAKTVIEAKGKSVDTDVAMNAKNTAIANAKAQVSLALKGSLTCGGTTLTGPSMTATAGACVQEGQTTGVINGVVVNNDSVARDATVSISPNVKAPVNLTAVPANGGSKPYSFSGLAVGTYTVTATMNSMTANQTVNIIKCDTPVNHWVSVSCTSPEEITVNGSVLVDCTVLADSGQITLSAVSNDANSRVSGINCYSNGGSQTCPSGGTFEFRLTGQHEGMTSVTVKASANGVVSDPVVLGPMPVDPDTGGF
jgi:hypothetical protein